MGGSATKSAGATPFDTSPPPTPVSIVDVHGEGTDFIVTFSGPVTIDAGEVPDSFLNISGASVTAITGHAGAVISIETDGGDYSSGLPWELTGQPGWLLTPIAGTQSGTTS